MDSRSSIVRQANIETTNVSHPAAIAWIDQEDKRSDPETGYETRDAYYNADIGDLSADPDQEEKLREWGLYYGANVCKPVVDMAISFCRVASMRIVAEGETETEKEDAKTHDAIFQKKVIRDNKARSVLSDAIRDRHMRGFGFLSAWQGPRDSTVYLEAPNPHNTMVSYDKRYKRDKQYVVKFWTDSISDPQDPTKEITVTCADVEYPGSIIPVWVREGREKTDEWDVRTWDLPPMEDSEGNYVTDDDGNTIPAEFVPNPYNMVTTWRIGKGDAKHDCVRMYQNAFTFVFVNLMLVTGANGQRRRVLLRDGQALGVAGAGGGQFGSGHGDGDQNDAPQVIDVPADGVLELFGARLGEFAEQGPEAFIPTLELIGQQVSKDSMTPSYAFSMTGDKPSGRALREANKALVSWVKDDWESELRPEVEEWLSEAYAMLEWQSLPNGVLFEDVPRRKVVVTIDDPNGLDPIELAEMVRTLAPNLELPDEEALRMLGFDTDRIPALLEAIRLTKESRAENASEDN